ncbi:VOC family protein [Pseudonocardia phyllosphaerae]|uniref:VOC family protein n=1 Tax=Pseudonocardia phyllosphaerae TaxID=3390502 RepID=UPI0039793B7F
MPCTFNHSILAARDREVSAAFFRHVLEAAEAPSWGPFTNVLLDGGVMIQFADLSVEEHPEIQPQHYAFLVDDALFDRALAKLDTDGTAYWADPQRTRPGEINHEHGGRGVYFCDPAGHYLELITQPYL